MSNVIYGDSDIRPFLLQRLAQQHVGDSVLFLEEFPIYGGDVRADIVALNESLHGYEIKSAKDKLNRLPNQVEAYGAVFDRASVVVSECHLEPVISIVPNWWEILLIQSSGDSICFKTRQRGRTNPAREARALAALLWKAETLSLLITLGLDAGMRSATMAQMMDRLVASVPVRQLGIYVRQKLHARGDWLSASRQKRCDAMRQPHATPFRHRRTLYSRTSECNRLPN